MLSQKNVFGVRQYLEATVRQSVSTLKTDMKLHSSGPPSYVGRLYQLLWPIMAVEIHAALVA